MLIFLCLSLIFNWWCPRSICNAIFHNFCMYISKLSKGRLPWNLRSQRLLYSKKLTTLAFLTYTQDNSSSSSSSFFMFSLVSHPSFTPGQRRPEAYSLILYYTNLSMLFEAISFPTCSLLSSSHLLSSPRLLQFCNTCKYIFDFGPSLDFFASFPAPKIMLIIVLFYHSSHYFFQATSRYWQGVQTPTDSPSVI